MVGATEHPHGFANLLGGTILAAKAKRMHLPARGVSPHRCYIPLVTPHGRFEFHPCHRRQDGSFALSPVSPDEANDGADQEERHDDTYQDKDSQLQFQ